MRRTQRPRSRRARSGYGLRARSRRISCAVEIKHCAGSEELTRVLVVDATVLPALHKQLETHLQEVQNAQRAVSERLTKKEGSLAPTSAS